MGVIIDDQFSYIDKREGDSILKIPSYLGVKMPPTETFLGITLLAFLDATDKKRLLQQYPIRKHTERTRTRSREVEAESERNETTGLLLRARRVL